MDFEKAKEFLAPAAVEVHHTLDDVGAMLEAHHGDNAPRRTLAQVALGDIRRGIDALAALGHKFSLVLNAPNAPLEFPKMVYKANGGTMIVESQDELARAEADGWVDHPEKAA